MLWGDVAFNGRVNKLCIV